MKRRRFLKNTACAGIGVHVYPMLSRHTQEEQSLRLIIDADTANEVDDLFAIVAALLAPSLQVIGLTSAQYHTSPLAPNDSVVESQRLNKEVLELMNRTEVPHLQGSNLPLVNELTPQPSEAAEFIIEQAMDLTADEKVSISILGPCTNIASAVLLAPDIVQKLRVYYLGFWHDPKQNTWSKREFNSRNDPSAVNVLLNNPNLDFHVMTATTSQHLVFEKEIADRHLKGKAGIGNYLVNRWESFNRWWQLSDPEKLKWVMWDVALIMALAYPDLARAESFITPHDNLKRSIWAFTKIDAKAMEDQFWKLLDNHTG
ncbi:MAG: nucleoside hydrolase [Saprospiraceae bacterium]|nr:nucleoside hydrolase [Saprospiraceae bacterium]